MKSREKKIFRIIMGEKILRNILGVLQMGISIEIFWGYSKNWYKFLGVLQKKLWNFDFFGKKSVKKISNKLKSSSILQKKCLSNIFEVSKIRGKHLRKSCIIWWLDGWMVGRLDGWMVQKFSSTLRIEMGPRTELREVEPRSARNQKIRPIHLT